MTGISSTGAVTASAAHNNNALGTSLRGWIRYAVANTGALTGITRSNPGAAATLAINTNDFRGIVNSVTGSTTAHTYINWSSGTGAASNVNGNTFTNLNVDTTGSVTFLNRGTTSMTATGTLSVSNNSIVTGFNKVSAGGTIGGFITGGGDSSPNGSTILANLNNFSNITASGVTAVTLWSDQNGASSSNGPTKTITNNTFNAITYGQRPNHRY